jgi:hypothetical protein
MENLINNSNVDKPFSDFQEKIYCKISEVTDFCWYYVTSYAWYIC